MRRQGRLEAGGKWSIVSLSLQGRRLGGSNRSCKERFWEGMDKHRSCPGFEPELMEEYWAEHSGAWADLEENRGVTFFVAGFFVKYYSLKKRAGHWKVVLKLGKCIKDIFQIYILNRIRIKEKSLLIAIYIFWFSNDCKYFPTLFWRVENLQEKWKETVDAHMSFRFTNEFICYIYFISCSFYIDIYFSFEQFENRLQVSWHFTPQLLFT